VLGFTPTLGQSGVVTILINVGAIKAQHPKKTRATNWTIEGRLSPRKDAGKVT